MSDGTPITREGVEFAYRTLLGRPPESEKAIAYGLSAGTLETLRRWILDGEEFPRKLAKVAPSAILRLQEATKKTLASAQPDVLDGPSRIVFVHLMKTAGNALRRRLESLVPPGTVYPEAQGRPGQQTIEDLAQYRLIAGHMTCDDALHVPGPKKVFTVLREPRDRLVSLYVYWNRHREEVVEERDLHKQRIARSSTLLEFLRSNDPHLRGSLYNGMTVNLAGDYRAKPTGTRYQHRYLPGMPDLTGPQLFQRALTNLLAMDYVAFVERLEEDRPKLMKALGLPDPGPLVPVNTRSDVNELLEPARPPEITKEVERELLRLTDLDRLLYRMARLHYG
jgi:hypothetical protein